MLRSCRLRRVPPQLLRHSAILWLQQALLRLWRLWCPSQRLLAMSAAGPQGVGEALSVERALRRLTAGLRRIGAQFFDRLTVLRIGDDGAIL